MKQLVLPEIASPAPAPHTWPVRAGVSPSRHAATDAAQTGTGRYKNLGTHVVRATMLLLAAWYTLRYLGDPQLPGNQLAFPLGWWGWFDQSATLRSTAALAHWNLDLRQHHYPLGYALLGLPGYLAAPNHPYFLVDLLALLGAFSGFVGLARRLAVPAAPAAVLFVLVTITDAAMFRQWVVPWNTTPVAAFIWLLLASCAAWLDGQRRPFRVGVLAGAVLACRPSDVLVIMPGLAMLAWAERRTRQKGRLGDFVRLVAGGAVVTLPIAALHLAIYGLAQSSYMRVSAGIGFTLHDLGWKAYVLLVDPYPWFADGQGLLQHAPWIALGMAGLVPAVLRGPKSLMLAATLLVHGVLYVAYADLLPIGLWRFLNIHYFVWAIPGYALLAALLLRDLSRPGRMRHVAWLSLVATTVVLCLRVLPKAVPDDRPAKAADFAGPLPPFIDTFLKGRLALRDGRGVMHDYTDFRGLLYPGGVRVIALRRDLTGPVEWLPGHAPYGFEGTHPGVRWTTSTRLVWPPQWLHQAPPPAIPVPEQ